MRDSAITGDKMILRCIYAYSAHSIRVGASIQEQLNQLQMAVTNGVTNSTLVGGIDEGSSSILSKTDAVGDTTVKIILHYVSLTLDAIHISQAVGGCLHRP